MAAGLRKAVGMLQVYATACFPRQTPRAVVSTRMEIPVSWSLAGYDSLGGLVPSWRR